MSVRFCFFSAKVFKVVGVREKFRVTSIDIKLDIRIIFYSGQRWNVYFSFRENGKKNCQQPQKFL